MLANSFAGIFNQHWNCSQEADWKIKDLLLVTNHVRAVGEVDGLLYLTRQPLLV